MNVYVKTNPRRTKSVKLNITSAMYIKGVHLNQKTVALNSTKLNKLRVVFTLWGVNTYNYTNPTNINYRVYMNMHISTDYSGADFH